MPLIKSNWKRFSQMYPTSNVFNLLCNISNPSMRTGLDFKSAQWTICIID